ncbi:MAG TPA: PIN domain-containing protein [Parafilimonas sp.]|nr:PIN domain-containing protein [Parafilimonas sp.]
MAYNFFIDSDVLLDVLLDRKPFVEESFELFKAQYNKQVQLFTTGTIVLNVQYTGSKLFGKTSAKAAIKELLSFMKICLTDKNTLTKAYNSSFADVEDAVQYYSATADKAIDFFVTRNTKDYKHADEHLKIITPAEAIKIIS